MGQAYSVTEINQYIKKMFIKDPYLNHIYVKERSQIVNTIPLDISISH